jgi:hypothetical protein
MTFLQPIVAPYFALALTHGPHQPEYTSYEEPGATDMVNLLTGDFTYSLPVMDVPGPNGAFPIPLTYNGGIGLDQQSSWTGLGWNINVGAITRGINQFPDDAAGESHTVKVMDLTGMRGWSSQMLGIGTMGWNNVQGHYGHLSLLSIVNADWNEHNTSVGIAGINFTNKGTKVDPVQMQFALTAVLTYGAGAEAAAARGVAAGTAIARQAAIELGINAALSTITASTGPAKPTSGYWKYSSRRRQKFLFREFKIWLDQTRVEDMYGVLYAGKAPLVNYTHRSGNVALSFKNAGQSQTIKAFQKTQVNGVNKGSASDINFYVDGVAEYKNIHNPTYLAIDDYNVGGPGLSGGIEPIRLDIGSVSTPREMTDEHARLALVPYKDYKVPFQYKGAPNPYFHHVGGTTGVTNPVPYFGIGVTPSGTTPSNTQSMSYDYQDVIFSEQQRVRSDVTDMLTASNTVNKLPQGRHVEWLSNGEIRNSQTYPASGFLDFLPYAERQIFRANFTSGATGAPTVYFGSTSSLTATITVDAQTASQIKANDVVTLGYTYVVTDAMGQPQQLYNKINTPVSSVTGTTILLRDVELESPGYGLAATFDLTYYTKSPQIQGGIGGYVITGQDGTNYHYSLPVYDFNEYSEIIDKNDSKKKSIVSRVHPFANTWLLTAITGSDFVDRNQNGLADDGDWGYWVKFNYGKHSDNYEWRMPFQNYRRDFTDRSNNYSSGTKQLYYLNSVETGSHVALFVKSPRLDGRGVNAATVLKLDEICLLTKEHYQKLITPVAQGGFGLSDYSNNTIWRCLATDISSAARNYMNKNTSKRVVLTHSYDLCKATPNSIADGGGKLTLTRVSVRGRSEVKIVPDYVFEYGTNPSYGEHSWDGWGMFHPSGTSSGTSHNVTTSDGAQWSLKKVVTPLGSEVEVAYERDTYSDVSGNDLVGKQIIFNQGPKEWYGRDSNDLWDGGDGAPLRNAISEGQLHEGDFINIRGSAMLRCVDGTYKEVTYDEKHVQVIYINAQEQLIRLGKPLFVNPACMETERMYFASNQGWFEILQWAQPGGNTRVSSITMTDDVGTSNKIRYLYTDPEGFSSGSVSQEPDYNKNAYVPESVYELGWSARTPVVYGMVTVLNGLLTNDADYHTRTVYEFEMPTPTTINYKPRLVFGTGITYKHVYEQEPGGDPKFIYRDFALVKEHVIEDHSSKIGALKSVRVYQQDNTLINAVTLTNNYNITTGDGGTNMGLKTQGTLMNEVLTEWRPYQGPNGREYNLYHKLARTTVLSYQYDVVEKQEEVRGGLKVTTRNNGWDKYTGEVLDQTVINSVGISTRTIQIPAYKKYDDMKPKALGGKNMLSAQAGVYVYKANAAGATAGLIGARVQTWKNDWNNYRLYASGNYGDGTEGPSVWRKSASFDWVGAYTRLQQDGTRQFSGADDFVFTTGAANSNWQKDEEVVRYDHLSTPLDSRDINSNGSSLKMGYKGQVVIAQAYNAYYNEIAFSSAEDLIEGQPFFGGEVGIGNAVVVKKSRGETTITHAGDAAISLGTGTAFVYKTSGLRPQTYLAKVWTNSANGKIYYKINGGAEVLSTFARPIAGNYMISIEIPITGTITSFEVGVKSAGGTILFDDFRFQPVNSRMSCYVYDARDMDYSNTGNVASVDYTLNDENLYVKYEYNEQGVLVKSFQESFKYGEKLMTESKNHYKRTE